MAKHLFVITFVIIVSSCKNTDYLGENKKEYNDKTLIELSSYNESLLKNKQLSSRGFWDVLQKTLEVAAQDAIGAGAGIYFSKSIIFGAGAASGGTGAVVTTAIIGSVCAATTSINAYNRFEECEYNDEEFVSRVEFEELEPTDIAKIYAANTVSSNTSIEDEEYEYNAILEKINLPEEFSYLKRIGEDHNAIIKASLIRPQTRGGGIEEPEITPELPELDENELEEIIQVLESDEFKNLKKDITKELADSYVSESFNLDVFFANNPMGSERLEEAFKLYIELYRNFPRNIDDAISIANNYINIIEKNNEFTSEEKASIYGAIVVSMYSIQIWL